jgi:hypothetical protein
VIVSEGRGVVVGVTVNVGTEVLLKMGSGITVSLEGMLVDVFAGKGEAEAVGFPSVALQAFVIKNISSSKYELFTVILLLY